MWFAFKVLDHFFSFNTDSILLEFVLDLTINMTSSYYEELQKKNRTLCPNWWN